MIYAKRIVLGLYRFYRTHFQNTPNIKTFFGYTLVAMATPLLRGVHCLFSKNHQKIANFTVISSSDPKYCFKFGILAIKIEPHVPMIAAKSVEKWQVLIIGD